MALSFFFFFFFFRNKRTGNEVWTMRALRLKLIATWHQSALDSPHASSLALHLLKNRYLIGCFVLKWTRSLSKARTSLRFDEWRLRVSFYFILLFPFFFYFFARIGVVTSSALIMEREFNLLKDA